MVITFQAYNLNAYGNRKCFKENIISREVEIKSRKITATTINTLTCFYKQTRTTSASRHNQLFRLVSTSRSAYYEYYYYYDYYDYYYYHPPLWQSPLILLPFPLRLTILDKHSSLQSADFFGPNQQAHSGPVSLSRAACRCSAAINPRRSVTQTNLHYDTTWTAFKPPRIATKSTHTNNTHLRDRVVSGDWVSVVLFGFTALRVDVLGSRRLLQLHHTVRPYRHNPHPE